MQDERLFNFGDNGVPQWRCPVAAQTRTAIVLIVEAKTAVNNDGSSGLYARRSTDDGATWSTIYPVVPVAGASNCSPVYDPATGRIWLAFAVDAATTSATAWRTWSDDDGITWATPVDVTSSVKAAGVGELYYGPNPGLRSTTGRLIFPRYHRTTSSAVAWIGTDYSDDNGATWSYSTVNTAVSGNGGAIEAAIILRPDGALLMDCRHKSTVNSRRQTVSTDNGTTWGDVSTYSLNCGESQGSLVRVGNHLGLVLPGGYQDRARLAFHSSTNGTFTTKYRRYIGDGGYAAYSQTLPLADGRLLVIHEAGDDVHGNLGVSTSWAHDIRTTYVVDPWRDIVNPNPHTDYLAKFGAGVTHFLPPLSDERAYFSDTQGTQLAQHRAGVAIHSVLDRGPSRTLWTSANNNYLRLEEHPTQGLALRFRPDGSRANGSALYYNESTAVYVHQTGVFTAYCRFQLEAWTSGETHNLFDNCNNGSLANGFSVMIDWDRMIRVRVRGGGSDRANQQFSSLGALNIGSVYDLMVSCNGPGTPVTVWLKEWGQSIDSQTGSNLTGSNNSNASSHVLCCGNRCPDVYCPLNGWVLRLPLLVNKAWDASEFDELVK